MLFDRIFAAGQQIFVTDFNACDGAGRPGTNGGVTRRPVDPLTGPRFTRVSAPEASSCAGCHNQPQAGGAGYFVANVFVLAQNAIPVSETILNPDFSQTFAKRNTLGMFGSGAIELLGREMTRDLLALKSQAISQAASSGKDVTVALVTKGVSFGSLTAHPEGSVDTGAVARVNPDLVIRPFSHKAAMRSVREFSVNSFNQHHRMQAVERFGLDTDPDQDGVTYKLLIGDITAATVFQAALPVPVRHGVGEHGSTVEHGEHLFAQVQCTTCHIPALPLDNPVFCDPVPTNPASGPFKTFSDTSQSVCFDLRKDERSGRGWNGARVHRILSGMSSATSTSRITAMSPIRRFSPTTVPPQSRATSSSPRNSGTLLIRRPTGIAETSIRFSRQLSRTGARRPVRRRSSRLCPTPIRPRP